MKRHEFISRSPNLGGQNKIQAYHQERLAMIYVRQSTLQQVERHQESTRLQYNLRNYAEALGWLPSRILIIDEDLGQSGSSAVGRPGFQRLVGEVGLDHVGLVLGLEMSRLARSCRDWYQLLEVCALFDTLIGDLDGIYDPSNYKDRLLLGLKGTMSEAELHILKRRMLEGKKSKARRGELGMHVPMGYVRRPSGEVMKDPDEQARNVIDLVFATFERCRTIDGVLRYLVEQRIQMPYRVRAGIDKGELHWVRPNRQTLRNLLHHPIYAGAYVYGRRPTDPKRKQPGRPSTGRVVAEWGEWEVCLKDRLPAYISWETYEKNQRQIESNTSHGIGVPRQGPSLLSGILVCGRCGQKLTTRYSNNGYGLRYTCATLRSSYGGDNCQSFCGQSLDELVTSLIFEVLKPAALEVSLQVAENLQAEREQLDHQWHCRLERSRYQVQRAERQYQAVEPENRLVARTLEKQWEEALQTQAQLQADYQQFLMQHPTPLSREQRQAMEQLAHQIPQLWNAPTTTSDQRQAIVRQMIERVMVELQGNSEIIHVQVLWQGGDQSQHEIRRPVARLEQLSYFPQLLERVVQLHQQHQSPGAIAHILNQEGWKPPKRRNTFNRGIIHTLLARHGLWTEPGRLRLSQKVARRDHEWTIPELARHLAIPQPTLYSWMKQGKLAARQETVANRSIWLIHADSQELRRLQQLRTAPKTWAAHVRVD